MVANLRTQSLLFRSRVFGFTVKLLRCNPAIKFVLIHCIKPGLQAVPLVLPILDGALLNPLFLFERKLQFVVEPFEDRLRYDKGLNYRGELPREHFFARVRLIAFSPVARAMVIHISAFLQFADHTAPAMSAADQARKREVMDVFSMPGFEAIL